ncbi:Na+/H+ antiporter subunit E [Microbulbifer agarilyticus]|uniref:Na+/H+ antiporter subunit E n=1 Tax=Microbulbifer agarilyticus TaxID=260552 RepID=UPI001CD21D5E|nr:Na+/H+ antiporter subunit E [Microbulbifer agarilyticus]MCA0899672.1 Na+/H+ antiporter subunit E [Microbulbifer agarilyticus]
MQLFLMNILLAISWCALTSDATLDNVVVGMIIGFLAMALSPVRKFNDGYFRRLPKVLALIGYFLKELLVSGLRATWEVLAPASHRQPCVVEVPTSYPDDNELLLLSQLLSLTPGTLVVDIDDENKTLYVHSMFVSDGAQFRKELHDGLEKKIREAFE